MSGSSMDGCVALVTGASRGIGAEVAGRFARAGATVVAVARTRTDGDHELPGGLEGTVAAITAAGGRASAVVADLASPEDRGRMIHEVLGTHGRVDVLVNNAAVTFYAPVAELPARRFDLMFELQVRAAVELSQAVLPGMRGVGRGWILNLSSRSARPPVGPPFPPAKGDTVYGMCKAALERFTVGLAAEEHAHGIAVNALLPAGVVLTPGVLASGLADRVPAAAVEPVEVIAAAALALCTGDPATTTGLVLDAPSVLAASA